MLLTISGPSTSGKDSHWLEVADRLGFRREIPFTTREARPGEVNGLSYHFVSIREFQRLVMAGELTDWDYVLGNYYGTGRSLGERVRRGERVSLQVLGRMALRLKRQLGDVRTVMLVPTDFDSLQDRLSARKYGPNDLAQRLALANEEVAHAPMFDVIVPDGDLLADDAIGQIAADIIDGYEAGREPGRNAGSR